MARRRETTAPDITVLSDDEARRAIRTLENRLGELAQFKENYPADQFAPTSMALTDKINASIEQIYGPHSTQFHRHQIDGLNSAALMMAGYEDPREILEGYERGVERAELTLNTLIDLCREQLAAEGENPTDRARRAFGELDLHPEIARAASKLFEDGHYANAIEDACKALEAMVTMRSGVSDRSGTDLMNYVFSPKAPVLAFNSGEGDTEQSERQGMRSLYAGVMLALRNPRAHNLVIDTAELAVEYIGFVSMLTKLLDRAKRIQ